MTYSELHESVNQNKYINVHKLQPNDFKNHNKWQDTMYRNTDKGVKESHVFTAFSAQAGTVFKQRHKQSECTYDYLLPTTRSKKARLYNREERKALLELEKVLNELESLQSTLGKIPAQNQVRK